MDLHHNKPSPLPKHDRPFLMTILCLFSWVYFGLLFALFITGLIYSGWVTDAINLYTDVSQYSKIGVSLVLGISSVMFLLALTGSVLLWKMRRPGLYVFGISALLLICLQIYRPGLSFSGAGISIALFILFALYYRRLR